MESVLGKSFHHIAVVLVDPHFRFQPLSTYILSINRACNTIRSPYPISL
jgi:hypothetical protein